VEKRTYRYAEHELVEDVPDDEWITITTTTIARAT
jgi:hypothetical protein